MVKLLKMPEQVKQNIWDGFLAPKHCFEDNIDMICLSYFPPLKVICITLSRNRLHMCFSILVEEV